MILLCWWRCNNRSNNKKMKITTATIIITIDCNNGDGDNDSYNSEKIVTRLYNILNYDFSISYSSSLSLPSIYHTLLRIHLLCEYMSVVITLYTLSITGRNLYSMKFSVCKHKQLRIHLK
jgi:hypothetical protein